MADGDPVEMDVVPEEPPPAVNVPSTPSPAAVSESSSAEKTPTGPNVADGNGLEVDNVLERLGVRHVDEQDARKEVLAKAEARWAAAKAKKQAEAAEKQTKGSVSAGKGKDPARPKPKEVSEVVDVAGSASSMDEAGAAEGGEQEGMQKKPEEKGKGKATMLREVLDESYKVRIGDLTPFEEEEQARRLAMQETQAGSSSASDPSSAAGKGKEKQRQGEPTSSGKGKGKRTEKGPEDGKKRSSMLPPPTRPPAPLTTSKPSGGREAEVRKPSSQPSMTPSSVRRQEGEPGERRVGKGPDTSAGKGTGSSSKAGMGGAERRREGGSSRGSSSASARQGSVTCPMCGRDVPVVDVSSPDEQLNEHLDRCMRREKTQRARRRRAEEEDEKDETSEEEEGEVRGRRVTRSARRRGQEEEGGGEVERPRPAVVRQDSLAFCDDEESEPEQAPRVSPVSVRNAGGGGAGKGKGKKRARPRDEDEEEAEEGGRGKVRGNLVLDDFDENDYKQRLAEYEEGIAEAEGAGAVEVKPEVGEMGMENARGQGLDPQDQSLVLPGGFTLGARVNRKLYWYQRTGVRWMWELHQQGAGGILGDEMGLGKTVQLSAFLGGLHESGYLNSALIICPATIIAQWVTELATWAPRLRVVVLHRSGRAFAAQPGHKVPRFVSRVLRMRGVACITTYESLKTLREVLLPHAWTYAVLDEGQKIRNPDAEVTVCAKQLATVHRLILSGTPIQNNLRELWSLFDFVFPGRLGTLPAFETEMALPIRVGGYSNATHHQVQLAYRCAVVLKTLISPYLLRRMKVDIMEILPMPKKTEQVLFCKLTAAQRALYRGVLSSPEINLIVQGKASHFRAISVLRKVCNHADLAADPEAEGADLLRRSGERDEDDDAGSDDDYAAALKRKAALQADFGAVARSGKLQVLEEVLPRWKAQGHKVLLFSQTRQMLHILEKLVQRHRWSYMRMDGATNVGARPGMIERFNSDDSIFIFLLTTRTGGLGINLTGADRVVLFDPDWNPQTDVQARERAWRLGQKRPVTIYRLVTTGTIEEKIYQRQIFKTAMTNRVLHDPKQRRLFSSRELSELFTLKDDFSDDEAPNDTADVFSEGVVTQSAISATNRRLKKKRRERAAEVQQQEVGGGGGGGREEEKQQEQDDCKILKAVFTGKGLASVLSHDVVEGGGGGEVAANSAVHMELQAQARRIAERAERTLRESSAQVSAALSVPGQQFTPTWTGRSGFAGSAPSLQRFGGGGGGNGLSSSSILSRFRETQAGEAGAGGGGVAVGGGGGEPDDAKYVALLDRIKKFLRERGPNVRTDVLLHHFRNVPESDAVIFKVMLRQVATHEGGKWSLKPEE